MTDNLRTADEDNPKGYYELEVVKELRTNSDWVNDSKGKVVKVISQLLKDLPTGYSYKVIFMRRKMEEILASQKQMLIRRGEPTDAVSDEQMSKMFNMHLLQIESWLEKQSNMDVLYVHYGDALKDPGSTAEKVNRFLDYSLDPNEMAAVVDNKLHRQRT
jgi:hypothetical protein